MIQRRIIPLLLAGLLFVLLAGAQVVAPKLWPTAKAQSPPAPSDSRDETRPITTLRWFMRWDAERIKTVALPLLAQFHAEHPTIRVLLENVSHSDDYYRQLRLQLDRGQPPDIFYPATHIAYELQQREQLVELEQFIRADDLDLSAYGSEQLQLYRNAAAQLYCLPVDVATLAVVYNRALFDTAGIAYPKGPWTWDDLLAVAAELTDDIDEDGIIDRYGIDRFYTYWPLLVWSATGHNVFDNPKQPTAFLLEEEASVTAVQWLADLHLDHRVMPAAGGVAGGENLFLSGRAAMQISGYWQIPSYLAAGLEIDVAPLPMGEYAVNRSDGSCLALASKSEHPQAAWTFLKFLAGPAGISARMMPDQQALTPAMATLYRQSFFINPLALPGSDLPTTSTIDPLALATPAAGTPVPLTFPLYDPFHMILDEWQPIADRELVHLWHGRRSADQTIGRMANAAEDLLEDLPDPAVPMLQTRKATKASTAPAPEDADSDIPNSVVIRPALTSTIHLTGTVAAVVSDTRSLTAGAISPPASPIQLPRHYFVAPTGDDAHSGLQATTPFATIQHALDLVAAGDTIHLAAGDYFENLTSATAGRADAPITLMGPPDAVLRGTGEASAAFYLTHDYYTLTGFTIDGLFGDPETKDGYTQKLLYVQGKGVKSGVTGLRVLHMRFQNAGGECLRLRYFAQHNEIAYSTFQVCGLLDFVFAEGGKNGEAIYIGTSADQWEDGKNPTADPDGSHHNWVHHNVMDTRGNECVEIKEGGYANLIEHNLCTGQLDPDSAGIGARGNKNIIRYNTIYSNVGAGVRLGGHEVDGIQYGVNNDVYGNSLLGNIAGGVKIVIEPQNRICGNRLERNVGKQVFGEGSDHYEPTASC